MLRAKKFHNNVFTEKVTEEIEQEEEEELPDEEENFEDDISKTESLSMSLSRGEASQLLHEGAEELDEVTISDPIEIKEDHNIMASLVEEETTIGTSSSSAASAQ